MGNPLFIRIAQSLRDQQRNLIGWWQNSPAEKRNLRLGNHSEVAVQEHIQVLESAIEKAEKEELGVCTVCHEHVETHWLETNYTNCVCIEHLSGEERSKLEAELELSQKVQKALLPQSVPDITGWELAAYSKPASIVGGDYFDFLRFRDGAAALVIADVMGKGMPASMLMASLQATLRIIVPDCESPEQVLVRANELFCHNIYLTKFVTLVMMRLEPGTHVLQYANAGHNPPLVVRRQADLKDGIVSLRPTGAAIGLVEETAFGVESVAINPGDMVLAYTDGLVESTNQAREEFGEERLKRFLVDNRHERPDRIIGLLRRELDAFAAGRPPGDDTTIIACRRIS